MTKISYALAYINYHKFYTYNFLGQKVTKERNVLVLSIVHTHPDLHCTYIDHFTTIFIATSKLGYK